MDMTQNQTSDRQRTRRRPRQPDANPNSDGGENSNVQAPNPGVTMERFPRRVRTRYGDYAQGIPPTAYSYHYHLQRTYGGSHTYIAGEHYVHVFGSTSSLGGNLGWPSFPGVGLPFPQGIYALGGGPSQIASRPAPLPYYQQTGTHSNSAIPLAEIQNFRHQQQPQTQHALPIPHPQHSNELLALGEPLEDQEFNIDSFTYEDLLGLQDSIGDVDTGLSQEDITRLLVTRSFSASSGTGQSSEICVICQEEYEDKETVGALLCAHEFHANCIGEWLRRKNTCPICKGTGLPTGRASE
ncbi:Zinc finger, RING-type [Dillenia turbinata]|uniref:RING-type E3 ubiquitin transferase n=1 Tax=Dillenia turbinata TaxID=194707 RepID=A0AAN8Z0P9_9MAGN